MSGEYQEMGMYIYRLINTLDRADRTPLGDLEKLLDECAKTAASIRRYYEMIDGVDWKDES